MAADALELDLPRFRERLAAIRARVAEISIADSPPRIVIVSKYLTADDCRSLRAEAFGPLGENRAQDLARKVGPGEDRDGWHFIGHLQRNKVDSVVPRIGCLHSLDSERLARIVDAWVEESGDSPLPCLVQVNVSGEGTKGGLAPTEARERVAEWVRSLPGVRLVGLMTMAPDGEPEGARWIFRALRELRDELRRLLPDEAAERFTELSMGMSGDYEVAAEEGATLLRLGRILYS